MGWLVGPPKGPQGAPEAGTCPLEGRVVYWRLWLQGPGSPGASACVLVCGARWWALWWTGLCPGVAVRSGGLKAAYLVVGGAATLPG